ncbi:MAG TPA: chemotaxis protein CheW [Spirochaetia bacterium]|nr:chemotaxis protein CheW [Spirochaetia bacterium]
MRKRYVSFALGEGRYCVPVEQVLQIMRLEGLIEIPKPPPFVLGVLNLRGDIIPVVSLRARLELPREKVARASPDPRKRRVVITRVNGKPYGLDVDEVREIVEIEDGAVSTDSTTVFGGRADFLVGIARHEDGLYLVLDLPRVLGTARDLPIAGPPA